MNSKNGFAITNRDMALRAWQDSTELVRDYQTYSKEIKDDKELAELFAKYAEEIAQYSAKLLEKLRSYEF